MKNSAVEREKYVYVLSLMPPKFIGKIHPYSCNFQNSEMNWGIGMIWKSVFKKVKHNWKILYYKVFIFLEDYSKNWRYKCRMKIVEIKARLFYSSMLYYCLYLPTMSLWIRSYFRLRHKLYYIFFGTETNEKWNKNTINCFLKLCLKNCFWLVYHYLKPW